jgi:hypothetical protein
MPSRRDLARLDRHQRRMRRRVPDVARSREQARRTGQTLSSIPITLLRGIAPSTKARGSERRPAATGTRRRTSSTSSGQDPGEGELDPPDEPVPAFFGRSG